MRRKIYDRLVEWKRRSQGRTALLIEGARRVGKSWIAEEFARREYADYLLIDFSVADSSVRELFVHDLSNLDVFFRKMFAMYSKVLRKRQSLVIFDEVQLFPRAREAIKHLVADGRFDYLETGSLLSLKENTQGILLPSEEERITMFPMDFEEFLWSIGQGPLMDCIRDSFQALTPMGSGLHRRAMDVVREYMVVGGMPQVVEKYLQNSDLGEADREKRMILQLYQDDVAKHADRKSVV